MYKTILVMSIFVLVFTGCTNSDKKTGQIQDNTNNENRTGDEEGYISSDDEGVFLSDGVGEIKGTSTGEPGDSVPASSENPLNL